MKKETAAQKSKPIRLWIKSLLIIVACLTALATWPPGHVGPVLAQMPKGSEKKPEDVKKPEDKKLEPVLVPILVNILRNVRVKDKDTDAQREIKRSEINEIINETNKILKDAKITLDLCGIVEAFPDQGNDNGKIELEEEEKINNQSLKELERRTKNKGEGYKVVITNDIAREEGLLGLSPHDPTLPVSFLKVFKDKVIDPKAIGKTLAHEFCHVFTLGSYHWLKERKDYPEDRTQADNAGHSYDPTNLMFPADKDIFGKPAETNLTELQKKEINQKAKERGLDASKPKEDGSSKPLRLKRVSWVDELDDVVHEYIDLTNGSLFAENPTANLKIAINLRSLYPETSNVDSTIEVLFDTDHNSTTGLRVGSFYGIDKILRVRLTGRYPFTAQYGLFSAGLFDVRSENYIQLSPGSVERIHAILDVDGSALPSAYDVYDSVHQSIPLSLLDAMADQVPMGVRATNLKTGEFDEASFVFDYNPLPDPNLEMSPRGGRVGEKVNLKGTNYSPLSTIKIFVDDIEVLTTTTQGDGSFECSFTFPPVPAGEYFLIAKDNNWQTAFSMFEVETNTIPIEPRLTIDKGCGGSYQIGSPVNITYSVPQNAVITLKRRLTDGSEQALLRNQSAIGGVIYTLRATVGEPAGARQLILEAVAGELRGQAECAFIGVGREEQRLRTQITTDRGSVEKGQNPAYFVGEPISIKFRVDGAAQALVTIEDVLPDGRMQVFFRQTVTGNQTLQLNARITPPLGRESLRLTARAGEQTAKDQCSFTVFAAGGAPCAGGELLVRHAYSECNSDGFWHVVEDVYYACPPNGQITRFRVFDKKTEQRCGAGQAAPNPIGTLFKVADETCQAPVKVGTVVITECRNGLWDRATYTLFECLDKSRRVSRTPESSVTTGVRCTDAPPPLPIPQR